MKRHSISYLLWLIICAAMLFDGFALSEPPAKTNGKFVSP
jgi:hypothetical protein